MKGVNPGKYRHRVRILKPLDTQDAVTGAIARTWSTVVIETSVELSAVPAEVLTGTGREFHAAGTKQAEASARINLRWFPGLDETMCILWDESLYGIISIETDTTARREYRIAVKSETHLDEWDSPAPANALMDIEGNPLTFDDGTYITTAD